MLPIDLLFSVSSCREYYKHCDKQNCFTGLNWHLYCSTAIWSQRTAWCPGAFYYKIRVTAAESELHTCRVCTAPCECYYCFPM